MNEPSRISVVGRIARFALGHRRAMVVGWLAILVAALAVSTAVGSHYTNNNSLKGTQSQRATDLLRREFPAQAGDTDQIVLHATGGTVSDPAVKARVVPMLARVARLPHVTGVISPYGPAGRRQISKSGTIAFATVTFDERANALPKSAIQKVISVAQAAHSSRLDVQLGGQAIEQAQGVSLGPATAVGILAAMIVLLITFGSVVAMGLPIITALLGLGTAFGLIILTSHVFSMPDVSDQLAAMIGLGVGIDYALFIVTRFREAVRGGADIRSSVVEAMETAGRAVLFAGVTVIVALLGMLVLGVGFLAGLAISSAIAVALVMLATLTLLPALLSKAGARITRRDSPTETLDRRPVLWLQWAQLIRRRPWPAALAGLAIMLAVASPALSMRLGLSDAGNNPRSDTTRQAYDLLARGFGKGFNGPLLVVAQLPHANDPAALVQLNRTLAGSANVASVSPPRVSASGITAVDYVYPRSSPQAAATTNLVNSLRERILPPLAHATGATLLVGGATATGIDFTHVLSTKLPLFIAIVVVLAAILLLVVFRSIAIPLQAAAMNLLSIGAALGATVAIFQDGFLGGLFGVQAGPIEPWLPVMLFAIVFGLSMDYEVFLVSRIHEEWNRRRDASEAVVAGMASTGRVITAAATIMICVFMSFVFGADRVIKLFGLSLATAVFLDAFVIRSLLLPSVLELLGRRTWVLPGWLGRRLPSVAIERGPTPALEEA
jgi:putative drug exporter of the RND superfamily